MKKDIHPDLQTVTIRCACGAEYETLSTKEDLHVDVCSNCHPFYTGESRFVDSEGRISKFERKYGAESESEEGQAEEETSEEETTPSESQDEEAESLDEEEE
mgnify:CR=1 FL=1